MEKREEQQEFIESFGDVELKAASRKITKIEAELISESGGILKRDYCCCCPPSKADGGRCVVGKKRVCQDHSLLCGGCGMPACQRHSIWLDEIPFCHNCFMPPISGMWILYILLAVFGFALLWIVL